jgi:FlaA1/EpsC-like NDP-sugar epimerase
MHTALAHRLLRLRNRHFVFIDFMIFALTPILALYLRTDNFDSIHRYEQALVLYTFVALIWRMAVFHYFGMYRRYWRFIGASDFAQLMFATASALLITGVLYTVGKMLAPGIFNLPRSLPLLDAMLAFLLSGGMRASVRLTENLREGPPRLPAVTSHQPRRTLIVGAGYTGALLAREIRDNAQIQLEPVGFIDDDPHKHGMRIHGLPVLGGRNQLSQLITLHAIERLIIAMPSADGDVIRDVVAIGQQAGIAVQTMPGVHELLNGSVSISKLRNVQIEDLLRRVPIETDIAAVRRLLIGKRVLVTGGGGSIGSELCRQILRCSPRQLLLVGHGENSIFEIHQELTRWLAAERAADSSLPDTEIVPVIADLRFRDRVFGIFGRYQPEVVFHAAAHKHVPLMEANPVEAITNNVLGTRLLLAAAQAHAVERFVMISTDKAVNPTNVMGASKRVAELLVLQAARNSGCFYQVVRFGNVLGSRGSVIHTFKRQIANGGPVMVTHPDMVRYFMTIPEAVQLVLQAAVLGHGADVLMLDMGEPVRIVDLARDLIRLSGLQLGRDIEIAFSGLRPGEKLFEEMFKPNEEYQRTEHNKIFIARNAGQAVPNGLDEAVDALVAAALHNEGAAVIRQLCGILPEYAPWHAHGVSQNALSTTGAMPVVEKAVVPGQQRTMPRLQLNGIAGD